MRPGDILCVMGDAECGALDDPRGLNTQSSLCAVPVGTIVIAVSDSQTVLTSNTYNDDVMVLVPSSGMRWIRARDLSRPGHP